MADTHPSERRRVEVDVAADAVWALVAAGLLAKDAPTIAAACRAVGIAPNDIKRAEARRRGGTWEPPRGLDSLDEPREVSPIRLVPPLDERPVPGCTCRAPDSNRDRTPEVIPPPPARSAKERAKQPTEKYRMCHGPTHDPVEGALLLTSQFGHKNKQTGSRDSLCRECRAVVARDRRIELRRLASAGLAFTFTLTEDDWHAAECCPLCRHRIQVGERVRAFASCLEHETCPGGKSGSLH